MSGLRKFDKELKKALALSVLKPQYRQHSLADVPIFPISSDPTIVEIQELYRDRLVRFVQISPLKLKILRDGDPFDIPVTTSIQNEQTFHIIALSRGDGAGADLLVREYDNYTVAFRVYHNQAERMNAPWLTLQGIELPEFFGPSVETKFEFSYQQLENVFIGEGVFPGVFKFLLTFVDHPLQPSSPDKMRYFQTLFLFWGEGQRFRIVQHWILTHFTKSEMFHPTADMCAVIRDWDSLSKIAIQVRQHMIEIQLLSSLPTSMKASSPMSSTLQEVVGKLMKKEEKHASSGMIFRDDNGDFNIDCLVGGELLLLNHDYKRVAMFFMREAGYKGPWYTPLNRA